jgi:hypothetical protein
MWTAVQSAANGFDYMVAVADGSKLMFPSYLTQEGYRLLIEMDIVVESQLWQNEAIKLMDDQSSTLIRELKLNSQDFNNDEGVMTLQ